MHIKGRTKQTLEIRGYLKRKVVLLLFGKNVFDLVNLRQSKSVKHQRTLLIVLLILTIALCKMLVLQKATKKFKTENLNIKKLIIKTYFNYNEMYHEYN